MSLIKMNVYLNRFWNNTLKKIFIVDFLKKNNGSTNPTLGLVDAFCWSCVVEQLWKALHIQVI